MISSNSLSLSPTGPKTRSMRSPPKNSVSSAPVMPLDHADVGEVDMLVDLRRHLGDHQQPRDAAVAHGDRLGADRHQHVVLGRARQRRADSPCTSTIDTAAAVLSRSFSQLSR